MNLQKTKKKNFRFKSKIKFFVSKILGVAQIILIKY